MDTLAVVALIAGVLTASPCLPPGIPALTEMSQIAGQGYEATGIRPTEHYVVISRLYEAVDHRRYAVTFLFGRVVLVDDHPEDDMDLSWWIDPAILTDDVPPLIKGPDPTNSCAWRRRVTQEKF